MKQKNRIIRLIAQVLMKEHGLSEFDYEFVLQDGAAIYRKLRKEGLLVKKESIQ